VIIYLWIAIGSAIGGVARVLCQVFAASRFGEGFPYGTLFINILGSFIITFFAALTGPEGKISVSPSCRHFVMAGLCGGYTTFSSFSLQTLDLFYEGEAGRAGLNVLLSVGLCLIAGWLGFMAANAWNHLKG